MYLVWINTPINFTFSDDSVFLKKNLGGGHKFSEFACFFLVLCVGVVVAICCLSLSLKIVTKMLKMLFL